MMVMRVVVAVFMVFVFLRMLVSVTVFMQMIVFVVVVVSMLILRFILMVVVMVMSMVMREVNIKLHTLNGRFLLARNVEVIAVQLELSQLTFEPVGLHAQIEQRGDEHVASDAADEVEVKDFHLIFYFGHR